MGIKIDFVKETDKEYEEIKKLIPSASKYAFMKVDHLIVVPLFQVMDIINKHEEQEPTTKNNLGVDCISRADAERILTDLYHSDICDYCLLDILEDIKALPSVTPIRPKGHWIPTYGNVKCSECGSVKDSREVGKATHYCDFCGADMREVEE